MNNAKLSAAKQLGRDPRQAAPEDLPGPAEPNKQTREEFLNRAGTRRELYGPHLPSAN